MSIRAETRSEVADLADHLFRLLRTVNKVRSQLVAASSDVDWSAQILLARLVKDGPLRVGALADCVQSDISTVSRQVTALVQDGFIERRADQVDGRASLLFATDKARSVYATAVRVRDQHLSRVLAGWTSDERAQVSRLLAKLADDFERERFEVDPSLRDVLIRPTAGNKEF